MNFIADQTLSAHSHFVSAVAFIPPSAKFPRGQIATAGHDKIIYVYTVGDVCTEPVFSCIGHEDVCCAVAPLGDGMLVTGSWDKTARIWENGKCLSVLKGHEFAIWAVLGLPNGDVLTGSADKMLKLWRNGECVHTAKGHLDCVRGLALIPGEGFASCSNDGVVKIWNMNLSCVRELHGHTAFVYSVAVLPNGSIVSCGEDRTIRLWGDGECRQTINVPTSSVWSVCALPNNDIVAGSSDNVARVFSCDESRFASDSLITEFEEQNATFAIPSQQMGDINKEDLQSEESLSKPGTHDGQTKMIKGSGGTVFAYQWDAGQIKWNKIGEVVNAVGSSSKQLLNGVEYDYVFDIDVGDGAPNRKLGYNSTENPYVAAQRFIHEQEIGQHFLDQIAEFITQNARTVTLGDQGEQTTGDPFTGGGRYIPGSSTGVGGFGAGAAEPDPFTGGTKYVPNYGDDKAGGYVPAPAAKGKGFVSNSVYVDFKGAKYDGMLSKVKEFNDKTKSPLTVEELSCLADLVEGLSNGRVRIEKIVYDILAKTLSEWEGNFIFPILDLFRVLCVNSESSQYFGACFKHSTFDVVQALWEAHLKTEHTKFEETSGMLVLKCYCNSFSNVSSREMMWSQCKSVLEKVSKFISKAEKANSQQALSSLLLK